MVGKPNTNIYEIIDVFKWEDENADAVSWSTAGPKTKTGEAKRETNPELLDSILEQCLLQAMNYNTGLRN